MAQTSELKTSVDLKQSASRTHASIPEDIREANGIGDSLARLSVGVEHVDDRIIDLRNAFSRIRIASGTEK